MTYFQLFKHSLASLKAVEEDVSPLDVEYIMFHAFSLTKETLLCRYHDLIVDHAALSLFHDLFKKRLDGCPVVYILGYQWFCSHRYSCPEGVLIPRPETECLVEAVIDYIKDKNLAKLCVLECGSGTGVISIELALRFPDLRVFSWDINELAVKTAMKNARELNASNVSFFCADFFEPVRAG